MGEWRERKEMKYIWRIPVKELLEWQRDLERIRENKISYEKVKRERNEMWYCENYIFLNIYVNI